MKLNIAPDAEKLVHELVVLTGFDSPGEAIMQALVLARWLYGEQASGRSVAIVDEEKNRVRHFTLQRGPM
jgi:hypothetical protein